MDPQIPEAQAAQIREALFAGRKIQAIKLLRETAGLQLVDAKTVVEKLEAELRQTSPEKFTARKNGCGTGAVCCLLFVVFLAWGASQAFGARARDFLKQTDAWFDQDEGLRIAANVMSWQSEAGSWPKNTDTASVAYDGERSKLRGTFDNGATCDEIRLLGRAYGATHQMRFRTGAVMGIEHILRAQYENGGWPQSFPPGNGYARYITFNDDTFVHLMALMREVSREDR